MHEQSLVEHLLDEVDRLAKREGALAVVAIELELGPLAGVEPPLLEAAFERLAPERWGRKVALALCATPLVVCCQACGGEFEPDGFRFRCPRCDSAETEILRGDAVLLRRITFDVPSPQPVPG